MGGAGGPGRLLPALGALRLGGPDLHAYHREGAGRRGSVPDQPLRALFRRDHGLEPRQDRPPGPQDRRVAVPGEPGGLRHPQCHPRRAPRRALRAPYAHGQRHRRLDAAGRALADFAARAVGHPDLGYHDFEGIATRDDEKPRLVADLGDSTHLILRNHGLLTVGETVADAFVAMYFLESSCAIQVRAQSGGGELIPVPKEVLDAAYAGPARPRGRGETIWPGLLRRLDRIDPSYKSWRPAAEPTNGVAAIGDAVSVSSGGARRACGRSARDAGAGGPARSRCRAESGPPCGCDDARARRCRRRSHAGGRTRSG